MRNIFAKATLLEAQPSRLSELERDHIATLANGCRLCWAASVNGRLFPTNFPLLSTDDYMVVPALGALVPGYVLFIAKRHQGSTASLSTSQLDQLERQLQQVTARLHTAFPSFEWLVFEHGTTKDKGLKACCIEHLHLHIIPLSGVTDLMADVFARLDCQAVILDELGQLYEAIDSGPTNYILMRRRGQPFQVIQPELYSSQFMRQMIARRLGIPAAWNWQHHPHQGNILSTLHGFRNVGLTPRTVYFAHAIDELESGDLINYLERSRRVFQRVCPHVEVASMYQLLERDDHDRPVLDDSTLVEIERAYLEACDLVVVDLSRSDWQYVGALMEIAYAVRAGIPVVAITGSSAIARRRWLQAHVSRFVADVAEAADVIAGMFPSDRAIPTHA